MTDSEMRRNAGQFAKLWANRGYEKGESLPFWLSLLRDVFGIKHPGNYIAFV